MIWTNSNVVLLKFWLIRKYSTVFTTLDKRFGDRYRRKDVIKVSLEQQF